MHRNVIELKKEYTDPSFKESFKAFFSLSYFLDYLIYPKDFSPPVEFKDAITLTDDGKTCLEVLHSLKPDIDIHVANFLLFRQFHYHEILIDLNQSDISVIENFLSSNLIKKHINFPWTFERTLYDKFFDIFHPNIRTLEYDHTITLIKDTPQGVFQINKYLAGPFGLVESVESRSIRPTLSPLLAHCSDPGCSHTHQVNLTSTSGDLDILEKNLNRALRNEFGPKSEWTALFFGFMDSRVYHYDSFNPSTLPFLLINGFNLNEIKKLLDILIPTNIDLIRSKIDTSHPKFLLFKDHPSKISDALTLDEAFQIALILPDREIVSKLESLIDSEAIYIPPSEVRSPMLCWENTGFINTTMHASNKGIAYKAHSIPNTLSKLKRLILTLYTDENKQSELEWHLRHTDGDTTQRRLDKYIKTSNPRDVVRSLLLKDKDVLVKVFEYLKYGNFFLPANTTEEEYLIDKLLWKLGFVYTTLSNEHHIFWSRMEAFNDDAARCIDYNQEECEALRSSSVNFYVSLEKILDSALCFLTWMFLSDHYSKTHFRFNLDIARQFTSHTLNSFQEGSDAPITFDPKGINTLYPLIQGFRILSDICTDFVNKDSELFRRSNEQIPKYSIKQDVFSFPFSHNHLIFDLEKEDQTISIGFLKEITKHLTQSNALDIRNRLQHNRPDFPKKDEIQVSCNILREIIREMEFKGFIPLVYIQRELKSDEFNRIQASYVNYRNSTVVVLYGDEFELTDMPDKNQPQIFVSSIRLKNSTECIRFNIEEQSSYVDMWDDWPKRKYQYSEE